MSPNDPNVALLEVVAARLGPALRERLVFVGGAVAGLLITDPAMPSIRPTEDVGLITHVAALDDFQAVEQELASRGFAHDMSQGAPICRWRVGEAVVDVMPTDEAILGFANRWYPLAVETAQLVLLPSNTQIRLVAPPVFIATKFEAFADRGNGDFLFSHDADSGLTDHSFRSPLTIFSPLAAHNLIVTGNTLVGYARSAVPAAVSLESERRRLLRGYDADVNRHFTLSGYRQSVENPTLPTGLFSVDSLFVCLVNSVRYASFVLDGMNSALPV